MANSYFQFKQFRVDQDRCAMKVCTDSCVLGAWTDVQGVCRVLDIGTGTGLLALMLAQRTTARIDAVETEDNAYNQARENVRLSPWPDRIHLYHTKIQNFTPPDLYDLIIANPPFFSKHLKRRDSPANLALHGENLSLEELAQAINRLLSLTGRFTVMLPEAQSGELEKKLALFGLQPASVLRLYERESSRLLRLIITYTRHSTEKQENQLIIRDSRGQYTESFGQLLRPYYLYL